MTALVDKLEKELARNCRLNNWDLGFKAAIDIVKHHSDWISVDERLPPNVTDEEKNYLLLIHKEWGCFIIGQYIKEDDEINSYMGNDPISDFAYWMPIPQPSSEVQNV